MGKVREVNGSLIDKMMITIQERVYGVEAFGKDWYFVGVNHC
jgi:hypothetical protein